MLADTWYTAWQGAAPFFWRHAELYPLLRPVGATPLDSDFFYLIRIRGEGIGLRLVMTPNGLPHDTDGDPPARWRKAVDMILTVEVRVTEAQSGIVRFHVSWDGEWADGDSEIQRHLSIRPADSGDSTKPNRQE